MSDTPDTDHWTAHAAEWIAWARKPGHDAFWAYRDAFAAIVGTGPGRAIDVGCGEGRVSRLLTERRWHVTATDPVRPLLDAARTARSAADYHQAQAHDLPLPDAGFDLVLAYNMLMDVADPAAAVSEMARVLSPDGRLVISIVHPMADMAMQDGPDATYFARQPFEDAENRDGLTMNFKGWTMPLSDYADLIARTGLVITRIAEPRPDPQAGWSGSAKWSRFPLFLWIVARRA
jgi:SAM-dependent methyltransferase